MSGPDEEERTGVHILEADDSHPTQKGKRGGERVAPRRPATPAHPHGQATPVRNPTPNRRGRRAALPIVLWRSPAPRGPSRGPTIELLARHRSPVWLIATSHAVVVSRPECDISR